MNEEIKAIVELLAADAPLEALLGDYASEPAIFDAEAPQDFPDGTAFIVVQDVSTMPWDTHSSIGYDMLIDIRCYAPRTGSYRELREVVKAARRVLHRARPTVENRLSGWIWAGGGPIPLPETEELVIGQVLTVRMLTHDAAAPV